MKKRFLQFFQSIFRRGKAKPKPPPILDALKEIASMRESAIERALRQPSPGYGQAVSDATLRHFIDHIDQYRQPIDFTVAKLIAEDLLKIREFMENFRDTAYHHPAVFDSLHRRLDELGAKPNWAQVIKMLLLKARDGDLPDMRQ